MNGWDKYWQDGDAAEAVRLFSIAGETRVPVADGFDFSNECKEGGDLIAGQLRNGRFAGSLLKDMTFLGTDLRRADFRGARLERVTFVATDLSHADLSHCELVECTFRSAKPDEAERFPQADGANTRTTCDVRCVNFQHTYLEGCAFEDAELDETTFEAAAVKNSRFDGCRGIHTSFRSTRADELAFLAGTFDRSCFAEAVIVQSPGTTLFQDTSLVSCDFRDAKVGLVPDDQLVSDASSKPRFNFSRGARLDDASFDLADLDDCDLLPGTVSDPSKSTGLCNTSFEGASLERVQFRGVNLASAVFDKAYLKQVAFLPLAGTKTLRCRLPNSSFANTYLREDCVFKDCFAVSSVFPNAQLEKVRFVGGEFPGSVFRNATFEDVAFDGSVDFSGSDFTRVFFKCCKFESGNFADCYFNESNLTKIHECRVRDQCLLTGADFSDSLLSLIDFSGCRCEKATFDGCHIDGTNFAGASLSEASFRGAYVTVAKAKESDYIGDDGHWRSDKQRLNFRGAAVSFASFARAELIGAVFAPEEGDPRQECNLTGADFSYALMRDAKIETRRAAEAVFDWAVLNNATAAKDGSSSCTPETDDSGAAPHPEPSRSWQIGPADVRQLHAPKASFRGTNLAGCTLHDTILANATLDQADLEHCNITEVDFNGASLAGTIGLHSIEMDPAGQRPEGWRGFASAVIQGTAVPDFGLLARWLDAGPLAAADRRKSWVAWKNNCHSLGMYTEESECYLEERRSEAWTWWRGMVRPGSAGNLIGHFVSMLIFASLLIGGLLFTCLTHWLIRDQLADPFSQWAPLSPYLVLGLLIVICSIPKVKTIVLDALYGYGELPVRIMLNAGVTIAVFALLYWFLTMDTMAGGSVWDLPAERTGIFAVPGMTGGDAQGAADRLEPVLDAWRVLYFSVVTFTTVGAGDITPYGLCKTFAAIQAMMGLALVALLIHAFARRTAGR